MDLEDNFVKQSDVFYQDENVTAFVAVAWRPNNPGHAIVVPNQHVENLYNLPFELGVIS